MFLELENFFNSAKNIIDESYELVCDMKNFYCSASKDANEIINSFNNILSNDFNYHYTNEFEDIKSGLDLAFNSLNSIFESYEDLSLSIEGYYYNNTGVFSKKESNFNYESYILYDEEFNFFSKDELKSASSYFDENNIFMFESFMYYK